MELRLAYPASISIHTVSVLFSHIKHGVGRERAKTTEMQEESQTFHLKGTEAEDSWPLKSHFINFFHLAFVNSTAPALWVLHEHMVTFIIIPCKVHYYESMGHVWGLLAPNPCLACVDFISGQEYSEAWDWFCFVSLEMQRTLRLLNTS